MGSSQSTETSITQTIDAITQNISNIMLSIKQSSSQNCQVIQNQKVVIGSSYGCDITINQTANTRCDLQSMFAPNTSNSLQSIAKQAVDQAAQNSTKAVQDTLSAMSSQDTSTQVSVKVRIKNLIENNISLELSNACISESTITQGQDFEIKFMDCSKKGSLTITNDADLVALSNCVNEAIANLIKNDEQINEVIQKTQTETDVSQRGLGAVIDNLVNSIGKAYAYTVIALVIVAGIALIVLIVLGLSPAGQGAINKASDKI